MGDIRSTGSSRQGISFAAASAHTRSNATRPADARFLAILASIDWMRRLKTEIEAIPESGSHYDLALQDRWRMYLEPKRREVVRLLDELQKSIIAYAEMRRQTANEPLVAFLGEVRLGLLADDLRHVQLPDLSESASLLDSLWICH